jgi:hypothetical protein
MKTGEKITVWLLYGVSKTENDEPILEGIFTHKVQAEATVRRLHTEGDSAHFFIREFETQPHNQ